jgi:hypothetical protein
MFSNLWVYFHVWWGVCRDGCRLMNGRSWGGDGVMAHLHGFGSGSIDPVLVMFDCLILSVFSCWSVLGTNRWVCAWYNSWDLCLVQFTQSVPGTIHSICAWHNTPNLCLAQFTRSVPGTIHPICAWHNTPDLCLAQIPAICSRHKNLLLRMAQQQNMKTLSFFH